MLNKSIDLNGHQDLVTAALERAKADGIFAEGAVVPSAVKSKPAGASSKNKSAKEKQNGAKKPVK